MRCYWSIHHRPGQHGPSDFAVTYQYTPAGDLVRVSRTNPATGNPIDNIISYNTLGQKISMTDPDMRHWTYTYDKNGNLKTQTDSRNITLVFDYDELNRLTRKTYPDENISSCICSLTITDNPFMALRISVTPRARYTLVSGGKFIRLQPSTPAAPVQGFLF